MKRGNAVNTASVVRPQSHRLENGSVLVIREAAAEDARAVLDYVERVSGESDFLTFGPGEFDFTEMQERDFLNECRNSDNQIYIIGLIDDTIVSTLSFSGGRRARLRHSGQFGMSVCKKHWKHGIGSLMLDALVDWARENEIVTKINLLVRTDNHRAINLYRRRGFVHEGTIRKEIRIDGTYYDQHWMGLEL